MTFAGGWQPGADPFGDMMKQVIQREVDTKPLEVVRCAKCRRMNTWSGTRKLLDENGVFIEYRCVDCVTEGSRLT